MPVGIKIPGQPNIADTLWLTVANQTNRVYFDQVTGIVWADMKKLDFTEGSGPANCNSPATPASHDQTTNSSGQKSSSS